MEAFCVSRRDLLKLGGAGLAILASGIELKAADTEPVIGLIFPPAVKPLPELDMMYPKGAKFLMMGLGVGTMTPEAFDALIPKVTSAAKEMKAKGAQGVVFMASSMTFYKGAEFNKQLVQSMRDATGLPCTTQSSAIVDGLNAFKAKRVAVATAYGDDINRRLTIFLKESGFQVEFIKGLELVLIDDPAKVTDKELMALCTDVCKSAPKADALLISCGGLITLRIHTALEKQFNIPVISSTPVGLWAGVRMMGMNSRVPGLGRLLEL